MNNKVRQIDLFQYFRYLWEKAVKLILIAVICGALFMGYNYLKQSDESKKPVVNAKKAILTSVRTANHDAFYAPASSPLPYTYSAKPANAFNAYAKVFVDFNYDFIEGNTKMDYYQMVKCLQQDANILLIRSDSLQKVIDDLKLRDYDDMSDITVDDLRWMIISNFLGSNVMQVFVTDVDPDRAAKISEAVINEFMENSKDYTSIDEVEVIDAPNVSIGSSDSVVKSPEISKTSLIKAFIIGGFGGAFMAAVIMFIVFILRDPVRTSKDLGYYDIKCMGLIPKKKDRQVEAYKRLAYDISLIDDCRVVTLVPIDKYSEKDEMLPTIEEELGKIGKKVATLDGKEVSVDKLAQKIKTDGEGKDLLVINEKNISDYADAIISAVNSDAVILMASYAKTEMKQLGFAINELSKTKKNIAGVVICDAKQI